MWSNQSSTSGVRGHTWPLCKTKRRVLGVSTDSGRGPREKGGGGRSLLLLWGGGGEGAVVVAVCRLFSVPATCRYITATDLLRQLHVLSR